MYQALGKKCTKTRAYQEGSYEKKEHLYINNDTDDRDGRFTICDGRTNSAGAAG